ncbi:MAG TPA: formate--phosphoribosylaminoimidazolecarboxamide ligase [Candidatus Limnocylindrales bacterium]|nr:formate--phosphoribosylaminoimidazolecarboxamide ligase [Candidatus Limnocylindrales bacterium]
MNKKHIIATLGSHSALQILKGAKDEGFETLVITTPERVAFYKSFPFIDEHMSIPTFSDFPLIEKKLIEKNVILIPHGSFVTYLGFGANKNMKVMYYGNKHVLDWEEDRMKQREWLEKADINMPKLFKNIDDISYPVIVKSYGAAGGKGYFYARDKEDYKNKINSMGSKQFIIQEYVIGVPLYIHFFYSPLDDKLEIMSIDKRYETNVDSLGRIPLSGQQGLKIEPSYVVVGNSSLVLREGMLAEAYEMGRRTVKASKKLIDKRGLFGPFCLETVISPERDFYVIEISCRIVAGTNLFTNGSPYSWLYYNEPMSTGRRIAREIKHAIKNNTLPLILD